MRSSKDSFEVSLAHLLDVGANCKFSNYRISKVKDFKTGLLIEPTNIKINEEGVLLIQDLSIETPQQSIYVDAHNGNTWIQCS